MQHAIILATKLQTHVRIPDADSDCKPETSVESHTLFKTTSSSIWQLWLHYRALHKHLDYIYLGHLCDALQLQECFYRELILCLPIPNWLQWPHSWHVLENHPTRISCTRLKINLFLVASCANIEWIGQAIDLSSQRTFHFNSKPLMWLMPQTHQISFSKCLEFRTY